MVKKKEERKRYYYNQFKVPTDQIQRTRVICKEDNKTS